MKYPFKKLTTIMLVLLLLVSMLAGCQRGEAEDTSNPADNIPPNLNMVENTDPTETTTPETTEPINENMATVIGDQVTVRSSPSVNANAVDYLDKGQQVEVVDQQTSLGLEWARIVSPNGWVAMEYLEMNYVPEETVGDPDETTPDETTPEETKPEETKPKDDDATNATMGIVVASELNIRDEASTNGDRLGGYVYGDRVAILETKNGWGRTNKGWISLTYVYLDGNKGTNTAKGIVTATQLRVRSGPGTQYDIVDTVNFGGRVNILEQIKYGETTWACINGGWISMDYVYVDGTTGEGTGTGTVTGDGLYIRSGPGTQYDSVGSLNKGDTVRIYAQFKIGDMTWGCTDKGWISMTYVDMDE